MWASEPDAGDTLRQGDLLRDFLLPMVSLPLRHVAPAGQEPTPGGSVVLETDKKAPLLLVVSHCCTNENGDHVAVAPVQRTKLKEGEERALQQLPTSWHDLNDSVTVTVRQHPLDPLMGILDPHLDSSIIYVAELAKTQTFGGDVASLVGHRVASMTPNGRRLLRLRLLLHWSRPETEDRALLASEGLPPLFGE